MIIWQPHDLIALNTLHERIPQQQVTYRNPGQPDFAPPWEEERFAQIDYILTKTRWKNHFHTVRTEPTLDYDSDHLPLTAQMTVKWKFGTTQKKPQPTRHKRCCTEEQIRHYNLQLDEQAFHWTTLQQTINDTALATRGTQPPRAKKPYLSDDAIQLLQDRDQASQRRDTATCKILTAQFRRQVKKDKKTYLTDMLRTFEGAQQNWPAIKYLRKKFTPQFSKRGSQKSSIPRNFPNDCADYFANTHWKAIPQPHTAQPQPLYEQAEDIGPFTIEELNQAIDTLKRNKAGGTDELITELFKDMRPTNREKLLHLYNEIYDREEIPDHFNEAMVVQIYKPGKTPELFSSYRPIALLNITYKIFRKDGARTLAKYNGS